MSAFDAGKRIEARGEEAVVPWLRRRFCDDCFIKTDSRDAEELRRFLQRYVGDFISRSVGGRFMVGIELKVEQEWTGRLFLETWSNKSVSKPGWMRYSCADHIVFFFVDKQRLIEGSLPALKEWFEKNGERFPELKQGKYEQKNDTWGRVVPHSAVSGILQLHDLKPEAKRR